MYYGIKLVHRRDEMVLKEDRIRVAICRWINNLGGNAPWVRIVY